MIPEESKLKRIIVDSMDDGHNVKCPRCWHWHGVTENFGHLHEEIAANPELAKEKLCDKCQRIILKEFPNHPSVPHIKAALEAQRRKYTVKTTWWFRLVHRVKWQMKRILKRTTQWT